MTARHTTSLHIAMAAAAARKRWWCYQKRPQLTCPDGHHLPRNSEFPECGFTRCAEWLGLERRECGLWVFLYVIRGGGVIVAGVDLNDLREMADMDTSPTAMLDYLGIFESGLARNP